MECKDNTWVRNNVIKVVRSKLYPWSSRIFGPQLRAEVCMSFVTDRAGEALF